MDKEIFDKARELLLIVKSYGINNPSIEVELTGRCTLYLGNCNGHDLQKVKYLMPSAQFRLRGIGEGCLVIGNILKDVHIEESSN